MALAVLPSLPVPAGWEGRRLATGPGASFADLAELTQLFATDPDHFQKLYAWTPGTAAADTLDDQPRPRIDKWVVVLEAPGSIPIGTIELIEGYPEPGIWYLGLIFLAPAWRSARLGTRWMEALADWTATRGGHELRLAVLASNPDARRLYERLSFAVVREVPEYEAGSRRDHCFVMARRLG
jgi:RimJ/RimL family protein N-acetyltransferase